MGISIGGFQLTFGSSLMIAQMFEHEEMSDLYKPQSNWNWFKRNHQYTRDQYGHFPLWNLPLLISGNGDPTMAILGMDANGYGRWEVSRLGESSSWRPWFIRGQCRDQSNAPVAGAIVQGFLTANDLYIGQTKCDDGGYYQLPTTYFGQNHYLVAYRAGSPDIAGTTVNTLQPAV